MLGVLTSIINTMTSALLNKLDSGTYPASLQGILEHMPAVTPGLMQRLVDMHQKHQLMHDSQIHCGRTTRLSL